MTKRYGVIDSTSTRSLTTGVAGTPRHPLFVSERFRKIQGRTNILKTAVRITNRKYSAREMYQTDEIGVTQDLNVCHVCCTHVNRLLSHVRRMTVKYI